MKRILVCLLLISAAGRGSAQTAAYAVSLIPPALQTAASDVKRDEQASFELTDVDRAMYTVHSVYTVLNAAGAGKLVFNEKTNRYRSLDDFEAITYDAAGAQTGRYKKKDLVKYAESEEFVEDGMNYYLQIPAPSYPFTVEYRYALRFTGTLFYPGYQIEAPDEAVQSASFSVKVPADLGIRYRLNHTAVAPVITQDGKNSLYQWSFKTIPANKRERSSPTSAAPSILLAPNRFAFYRTSGDMTSWKTFGDWEWQLIKGIDVLPDERRVFFDQLTARAGSEREKVRIVYEYLQKNFRYVSIQLGLGGYRPFPAKFTDENKYGDCKALSFYMCSVLKSLGIRSYLALVNAGYREEPLAPEFPMSGFDHVIVCVPQGKDSVWLDCTSKTSAFGVLGPFTENRNALLITERGGVLVPTPVSQAAGNAMHSATEIRLNDDGSGSSTTLLHASGLFADRLQAALGDNKDNQNSFVVNDLEFQQPDEQTLSAVPSSSGTSARIALRLEKVAPFSTGAKMFLNPRITRFFQFTIPASSGRTKDFYFDTPFDFADTTRYWLPAGYTLEALPDTLSVQCAYAAFHAGCRYEKETNCLVTTASLVLNRNRIPSGEYAQLKQFFDQVFLADGQKIVVKKE